MIDRLASGGPYRVRRNELPAGHPARREGRGGDLLVLVGDDLRMLGPDVSKTADRLRKRQAEVSCADLLIRAGRTSDTAACIAHAGRGLEERKIIKYVIVFLVIFLAMRVIFKGGDPAIIMGFAIGAFLAFCSVFMRL